MATEYAMALSMEDYSDEELRQVLRRSKTIAAIGVSVNPVRPSHFVGRYLKHRGFRVIPINPGTAGQVLWGENILARLEDAPKETDFVDVFRRSEAVPEIVRTALDTLPNLQTIWLQIGVEHKEAAELARANGVTVIQNRCPKIEHQRLFGELRKSGFNTGIISSRLPESW